MKVYVIRSVESGDNCFFDVNDLLVILNKFADINTCIHVSVIELMDAFMYLCTFVYDYNNVYMYVPAVSYTHLTLPTNAEV